MCRLQNIAMRYYQESLTTGQTDAQTDGQSDAGQNYFYVPLCFAGDTKLVILNRCKIGNRYAPRRYGSSKVDSRTCLTCALVGQ